ncbi:MAG: bifunctional demethylmenaquinone methyltransferase/2-methoxy-6-polyprenyl-1,4-benzoquinol methylase UbiE [Pirellulales bacterium]|nr:bifunctional demethylmenaquinone methyltransferase/2-methoxy-6-polyprenyl-1,4-benzoquinol methylase UbiE [Pirellulales bacterium]
MPVDKSGQRVRQMFGQIASRYDLLNHLLSLNTDRYWRWRTTRALSNQAGPVLDLCTGTGDLALAFYRATTADTPIVGADFCHEMLVIGREKGQRAGTNGRLTFVEADAQHLPFPDATFGIVTVAFGLRNVTDTDQGLREMARVCRPGGKVAVLEFSQPSIQPFRALYGWYFRNVLPRIGQLLASNSHEAYRYLPESVGEFPSGEALLERMRAAGLSQVVHHPLTLGIATLYLGTR